MQIAILADIHGNLTALEAVLQDMKQVCSDGFSRPSDMIAAEAATTNTPIIVAGDLLTGGPHPLATLRLLRSLGAIMIRGNTDDYLVDCDKGTFAGARSINQQWAALRWTYQHLDRESLDFLAELPERWVVTLPGGAPIRVVHGSLRSASKPLFPDRDPAALQLFRNAGLLKPTRQPANKLARLLARVEEPVLVCGHTHIPWQQEEERVLAVNPGSVGAPINGDPRAQYAILTWREGRWRVEHRAVPYDIDRVWLDFWESGLSARGGTFAQAYLLTIRTGRNVAGKLVAHAYALAAVAGYADREVLPDAVWDCAVSTFNWQVAAEGE